MEERSRFGPEPHVGMIDGLERLPVTGPLRSGGWRGAALTGYASSSLVAFSTSRTRRMEEQERVMSQIFGCCRDDFPSAHEARIGMSHAALGLSLARS